MNKLRIVAPIYLLFSQETCYRCGKIAPVVAVACRKFFDEREEPDDADANEDNEPVLVHGISDMPATLLQEILKLHPFYEKRRSRMAGCEYFMNICCHCKAHFGDFFLYSEPDGAFFPMEDAAVAAIKIKELPLQGTIDLAASYSMGPGADIFAKGKHI